MKSFERDYAVVLRRYLDRPGRIVREQCKFDASEIGRAMIIAGFSKDDSLRMHDRLQRRLVGQIVESDSTAARRILRRLAGGASKALVFELLMPHDLRDHAERERRWMLDNDKQQRVLDSIADQLVVLDGEGRIVRANAAWHRGDPCAAMSSRAIGDDFLANFQGNSLRPVLDALRDVLERADTVERRYSVEAGGQTRWINLRAAPLSTEVGGAVVLCIDVTRQVRIEEGMRQTDKLAAIATLAAGIAHDFINLLSSILGLTELCQGEAAEGTRLARIREATEKSRLLVRSILDFSRQTPECTAAVPLAEYIASLGEFLRAAVPKAIELRIDATCDCIVEIDRAQIEQVIFNLVNNACYAMRDRGGTVTVAAHCRGPDAFDADRAERPSTYAVVVVADTGMGIPSEVLPKIFEPFYTTKPVGEGTGLGLAAVHGIIGNHGGCVEVVSDVGRGTEFRIFLPLAGSRVVRPRPLETASLSPA